MCLPEWSDVERRDGALERVAARLARPDPLSRAELAVLYLLSHGMHEAMIGHILYMSRDTVQQHAAFARLKLAARNNAQAVAKAYRAGLIR